MTATKEDFEALRNALALSFQQVNQRLERIEKKIDENEERALTRFATLSQKVVQIDKRVDDLQAKVSYIDERTERTEKKVTQNNRRLEKLGEIGRRITAGDFARSG